MMKHLGSVITATAATAVALTVYGPHPPVPAGATASYAPAADAAKRPAPLLGVDVYSETNYSLPQTQAYGKVILGYLHNKLDAQVVGLMWDFCSPGFGSNVVHDCATDTKTSTGTMTPRDIAGLANIAKAYGLKIQMRPIIRVGPPSGWNNPKRSWQGHIQPPNQKKWFENLLAAELPYLKIAKKDHVKQFVLTTELAGVQLSRSWPWFLSKAHADCGCQVSYAAQMTQYLQQSRRLPPTMALGADLYPSLNLPAGASQSRVTAGWESFLSTVSESRLDRTSLDEISIRATVGAYRHPADWNAGGKSAPWVQARYFTGACHTAAKYHLQALFFYFVPLNDDPAAPFPFPAYFVNNAGTSAIRGCRSILKS
jgi:hypothetical protein